MGVESTDLSDRGTSSRVTQPRHFIVTIYGLYSRSRSGWLSVASLIALLRTLDVDETAVRSSISRLKRRQILNGKRRDGVAGYELSKNVEATLNEGDLRIFRRQRATLADGWVLAVFSVPESERHKRHQIRTQLTRLGFGTAAAGVWIAPAHFYEATSEILVQIGLDSYTDLFRADYLAFGDPREKVRQWWDLDELERLYGEFLSAHKSASLRTRVSCQQDAFVDYIKLLTDWRRLPYLDPGLPEELLPKNWIGLEASEVFLDLRSRLEADAHAYASSVLSG